jgi:hypothetical protein
VTSTVLLAVLAPDVEGGVDLGPADRRTGIVVRGAQAVARNLLRYFGSWTTLVGIPVSAPVVVAAFSAGRLYAVITIRIAGDAVIDIHVTADPSKVAELATLV